MDGRVERLALNFSAAGGVLVPAMKTSLPEFLVLPVCLLASACFATAEETTVKITLDQRPVFETLSKAGIRFQLPRSMELWNDSPEPSPPPRGISLSGEEKTGVVLEFGGGVSKAVAGCGISVNFAGKDLVGPGETYPPRLPIAAETPVRSLQVMTPAVSEASFREWFGSCAALFKIDTTKTDAWFQHRLWEDGASELELKHDTKDFRVRMSLVAPDERQRRTEFSSVLSISWPAGNEEETGGGQQRQSRTRVVPPPQTGQGGLPPQAPGP